MMANTETSGDDAAEEWSTTVNGKILPSRQTTLLRRRTEKAVKD